MVSGHRVNYPNGKHADAVSSDTSKTVSHTTIEPEVLPEPPVVRVGLNPAGNMTLYWDTPNNAKVVRDMGAPINGYYIYGGEAAVADEHEVSKLHFVEANTDLVLTSKDRVLGKFDKPDLDGDDNQLYYVFNDPDATLAVMPLLKTVLSTTICGTSKLWRSTQRSDGTWRTASGMIMVMPLMTATGPLNLEVDNRKDLEGGAFQGYEDLSEPRGRQNRPYRAVY